MAVKIISKELVKQKPNMEPKLQREIAIMKLMDHPNVLHMYDDFETEENLFVICNNISSYKGTNLMYSEGIWCWNMRKMANCLISWYGKAL